MSEAVDTRVVEARFDSKQFEQGVDKTVKKLDELKKSLNLESAGKSVAEIGNKVQESTEKASNSLEKLQDRFTSFTGMLKQKLLSGIADEIVGVFFKIKSGFESLVTSMSTAQIGVGMQRYTDILTSVRTLVAAGVKEGKAYDAIERLGEYADQTSYSLDSMVATMSKFKTAGADIDTAARMIEGLSNAAASMGVNAQQAERAYLNLQQAYSKKVMLQNDWISFESLPMVGTKFNQAIIDAAVKVGTLEAEKVNAKVKTKLEQQLKAGEITQEEYEDQLVQATTYKTKKKSGTKVRSAKGIKADNLGANLASRWFTDEVMEEVFGNTYYFGEVGIDEVNKLKSIERTLKKQIGEVDKLTGKKKDDKWFEDEFQKALNDHAAERRIEKLEELNEALEKGAIDQKEYNKQLDEFDKSNNLTKFGWDCFVAGQEARSFTDVLNTLKDSISRGWAKSFELIFGRLDEAKDFFTALTESKLAEGIYAIGEFRNAVLESWKNHGGRDSLLGVLEYMDDIAGSIWEKLGLIRDSEKYFEENFDQDTYNHILEEGGQAAADRYKDSIQQAADASPFEKMAEDLGIRLSMLGRDIKDFFKKIKDWFTEADGSGVSRIQRITNIITAFGTAAKGALTGVSMGLEFIGNIYKSFRGSFDALWGVIDKLTSRFSKTFDPNSTKEGIDVFQTLSDTFTNVLTVVQKLDKPLTKVIEVLGEVVGFFIDMGVSTFLTNIQFFTDAFAALLEILGIGSAQQAREAGVIDGIGKEIENLGIACKDAFQAISDFFNSLFDDLRKLLGIGDQVDGEEGGFFKNIENWFNTNTFIQNIKGWIDQAIKDIGSVDFWDRTFKSIFYTEETKYNGSMLETKWVEKPITTWVLQAVEDIKVWFADLPNKISGIGISIGDFFKSIFYYKTSVANTGTVWVKKDFTRQIEKTFKDMLEAVKKWFKELPSKAKSLGITIGDFFKSIFYYKTSVANSGTVWVKKDFTKQLENVFNDIKNWLVKDFPMFLHSIFAGVGDFVTMVWNALTGNNQTAEADNAAKNAADQTQASLDNSFANVTADGILGKLQTVASDIWNGILTIFTGNSDKAFNDDWLAKKVQAGIENIGKFADDAWKKISAFIVELPNKIASIFINDGKTEDDPEGVEGAITSFGQRVGEWVSTIPNTILGFWKNVETQTGTLWDTIIGWISGDKSDKGRLTKAQQDTVKAIEQHGGIQYAKVAEAAFKQQNWREDNPIFANLEDFFNNLKEYFIDKITHLPEDIANGLATGADLLQKVLDTATGWFNNSNKENIDKKKAEEEFAKKWIPFDKEKYRQIYNQKYNEIYKEIQNGATFKGWFKGWTISEIAEEADDRADSLATEAAEAYKATTDQSEEALKELASLGLKTENSPFLTALSNFGSTVFVLITETIPGFIGAGFEWIKEHAESWTEAIKGLFSGGEKTAEEETESFGDKIKNALQKVFKAHTFNQSIYNQIYSAHGFSAAESYREQTSNPIVVFFKNVVATVGDIFKEIGPTILNGINTALNWIGGKLGDAREFIEGLIKENKPIDEVLAETMEDKDNPGQENPLWEAVKSVGQSIWKMLTETIPAFIGSAATYIAQQVPKLLAPIFGGTSEETSKITDEQLKEALDKVEKFNAEGNAAEAAKAEQEYMKLYNEYNNQKSYSSDSPGLLDILGYLFGISGANAEGDAQENKDFGKSITSAIDTVKDVLASISNSNILKIALVAFAIGYFVKQLRVIVDNIQFIDDIGYAAKWAGISAGIIGIVAILGYLVKLASDGEELSEADRLAGKKTKLERVKEVLSDFVDDLKSILTYVSIIVGLLTLKEFFSWRKEVAEGEEEVEKTGKTVGEILKSSESTKSKLLELFTDKGPVAWLFGDKGLFSSAISSFGEGLGDTSGKAFGAWISGGLIGDLVEQLAGNANDALGQLGSGIEMLSTHLGTTVENLKYVKSDISEAIEVIPQVRDLISGLIDVLNIETITQATENTQGAVWSEETKQWVIKEKEDIIPNLGQITRAFNDISGSLSLFKNSISGYGDDSTKVTESLKTLLGLRSDMIEFANFASNDETGTYDKFKKALAGLGAILKLYSSSIDEDFNVIPKQLDIESVISLLRTLLGDNNLTGLMEEFSKDSLVKLDDNTLENSEKVIIFASALVSLAEACSQIKGGEGTAISKLIEEINKIKFTGDQGDIDTTVQNFGTLGNALGSFALNTANLSEDNIKNADHALTMLTRIAIGLGAIPDTSGLFSFITGDSGKDLGTFGQNIEELGQNLGHFMTSVDNLSTNGTSHTHNIDNLYMMLTALDEITRVAIQFTYLGSGRGSLTIFKEFSDIAMQSYFTGLANNLGSFINGILSIEKIVNEETKETARFDDADIAYINGMIKYINDLANILVKVTALDFSNLPDEGSNYSENPLTHYLERLLGALYIFSSDITRYDSTLKNLNKYKEDIQAYIDMVDDIYRMIRHTTTIGGNWDVGTNADRLGELTKSLFGWHEYDEHGYFASAKDIYHEGVFTSIVKFLDDAGVLTDKLNVSDNAVTMFKGLSDVIIAFMQTIAQMAETEAIADMTVSGFTSDYSAYVERLASTLESILNNKDKFEEFFNWGKNFSTESVTNVALMMTALNQIVQFISTMHDTQSFTDTTINSLANSQLWQKLFDIIQTTIIDDNKDFFEPKITPVLEITDDFKNQVDEMKKILGFVQNADGTWMDPSFTVKIEGIEIPQLSKIDEKLDALNKTVESIDTTASRFNNSLSNTKFVINGTEFSAVIGEDIDKWLGEHGFYVVRRTF